MALEKLPQVASPTLARHISVICGRYKAYGLCSARKHVAQGIREALKIVRSEANFIVNDVVVGRLRCTLQTAVG